ncbi:BrnT family toxin [Sphingoaurantiacus capsulatus]|uniref:BrnT family toxin n=1 Tax=Sphingoaurantiacus capsulatus TaxID=1771310 RepID=A0ABV7XEJ5_9SPHN
MEIDFDPAKDAANIAKHGISLKAAEGLDWEVAVVMADDRFDYGEVRFRAFGRIENAGFCFVFTERSGRLRAISLRRAHEKELRRYGA